VHANPDGQRHLLHARSGGHRVPLAPSRRDLKPRKETMSSIWRSPAPKPKSATRSGPRITTSTPNIILGRYPRTEKERKTLSCDCRQIRRSNFPTAAASEASGPSGYCGPGTGLQCKFHARLAIDFDCVRRRLPAFGRGFWSSHPRSPRIQTCGPKGRGESDERAAPRDL
jgi:hypothetical protein